jgi:hypothetical protein
MAQPLADLAAEMRADVFRRDAAMSRRGLFQSGILKDRHECSASAVRERIRPTLAIMRDEPPDGHRLHRMRKNTDRGRAEDQSHCLRCNRKGRRVGEGHSVSFNRLVGVESGLF